MKQITLYLLLALFFVVLNVGAQTVNILTKEAFKNPPRQYYPIPLWHMNGYLTDEGVTQQMTDAILKAGFNGASILPVKNTTPDFLSDDYFGIITTILETAKKLGGEVILYKDVDFQSGTAGGKL